MRPALPRLLAALTALAALLLITGCTGPAGRTTVIPADGIVKASTFAPLRSGAEVGIFEGTSHDVTYQWLFLGTPIEQPADACLAITVSNSASETVRKELDAVTVQEFSFCATAPVAGNPSVTMYLPVPWDAGEVTVYRSAGPDATPEPVGSATLTNSPNAILTFTPQRYDGLFHLVGSAPEAAEAKPEPTPTATASSKPQKVNQPDSYTSGGGGSPSGGQDKYLTDPVPAGKPKQVEPEDVKVDDAKTHTATLSIMADTIGRHLDQFNKDKLSVYPPDGVIMARQKVTFAENESVFDVLMRETKEAGIHLEFSWTPIYNSAYVEGIHNLYEFDCGELSGWMYKVNGWFPNYGASRYQLKAGDKIEWVYTCDLGRDIGGWWEGMGKP